MFFSLDYCMCKCFINNCLQWIFCRDKIILGVITVQLRLIAWRLSAQRYFADKPESSRYSFLVKLYFISLYDLTNIFINCPYEHQL